MSVAMFAGRLRLYVNDEPPVIAPELRGVRFDGWMVVWMWQLTWWRWTLQLTRRCHNRAKAASLGLTKERLANYAKRRQPPQSWYEEDHTGLY